MLHPPPPTPKTRNDVPLLVFLQRVRPVAARLPQLQHSHRLGRFGRVRRLARGAGGTTARGTAAVRWFPVRWRQALHSEGLALRRLLRLPGYDR